MCVDAEPEAWRVTLMTMVIAMTTGTMTIIMGRTCISVTVRRELPCRV